MAVLSEEQSMLRDMAQDWVNNESPVSAFRKLRDSGSRQGFDPAVYAEMASMGWTGIVIPEAYGGTDFGWFSLGLVLEELGRTLTPSPLASSSAAAAAIVLGGSDEQKDKWLPRIAAGEIVATLATDEGPRHGQGAIETRHFDGKLFGRKQFVDNGDSADLFVVLASDGWYLVDGGSAVLTRSTRSMTDSRSHAEIGFDSVPATKLDCGGEGLTDTILDQARILCAIEMLGMCRQLFDVTLDYLKQRIQFDQVLASFQALQHRMAALFTEIELTRSAVEGALAALDNGGDISVTAAQAKALANDMLNTMSREAIQLHGGIGMTDEFDVGLYIKRARILENAFGNSAFMRDRFAQLLAF